MAFKHSPKHEPKNHPMMEVEEVNDATNRVCGACGGTGLKSVTETCPVCNPDGKGSFVS